MSQNGVILGMIVWHIIYSQNNWHVYCVAFITDLAKHLCFNGFQYSLIMVMMFLYNGIG